MADEKVIDLDRLSRFHDKLKSNGLPLNNWQANKKYKLGYTVIQDGKLYRCKTEHTSTTTFDDTKFDIVGGSGSGIQNWSTNTAYNVGDLVVYGNGIYKCKTAHTSTTTFDDTKWTNLSIGYEKENLYTGIAFNTSTLTVTTSNSMLTKDFLIVKIAYSEDGTTVLMNKTFVIVPIIGEVHDFSYQESTTDYIVVTGEVIDATTFVFNFLEAYTIDNFKVVSIDGITLGSSSSGGEGATISDWAEGTSYSSGDLVIKDNQLYQANTTTSTTWVDSEWDLIATTLTNSTAYVQKIVPDVVAPYELLVKVGDTNYCKAPVNVLKKTGSQSDIAITLENFNNSSAYTNSGDFVSIGNGKAKISASKEFSTSPLVLDAKTVYVSEQIDYNGFKVVSGVVDNNTLLLLHFDDGIIDVCGHTVTVEDNVNIKLVSDSKFGENALQLDQASTGRYMYIPYDSKFDFGTGDFTIDFWWKVPTGVDPVPNDVWGCIIGGNYTSKQTQFLLSDTRSKLQIFPRDKTTISGEWELENCPIIEDNAYHHYAIIRSSGVVMYFIDGVLRSSGSNTYDYSLHNTDNDRVDLFNERAFNLCIAGYIDEFRISNVARWTTNFTPPNKAYGQGETQVTSLEVV